MTLDHCPHGYYLGWSNGLCRVCFPAARNALEATRPPKLRDAAVWAAFVHELRAEWLAAELRLAEDAHAARMLVFRRTDDWHEDDGPCLWWYLPVEEPPYVGTPLDDDWPGYHTHWSPLPSNSEIEWAELAAGVRHG